jgi:DNA-binding beta-propeller fold protein YncE
MASSTVTPISTARNRAGKPVYIGHCRLFGPDFIAATPDGKTVYIACEGPVVPVSTAGNEPGKPIRVALGYPMGMVIKP